jgi:hypothetical protein
MPKKTLLRKPKRNNGGEYPYYDPYGNSMGTGIGSPYGMDNPNMYNPNTMTPDMMQQRGQTQQTQLINAVDNKPTKTWGKWALHVLEEIPNTIDTIVKMNTDTVANLIEKNPKIKELKEVPSLPGMVQNQPGMIPGMTPGMGYDNYPYNTGYPPQNPGMMYGGAETIKPTELPTKALISEREATPLNQSSWLYVAIYLMLVFTLYIAPFVLLGFSLYYSRSIWPTGNSYWFGKQEYLEDSDSFDEARSLYKLVGGYYIHDYVLYVVIILLVYIVASIYLALSIYVKNNNTRYIILKSREFIVMGISIFMIVCYFAIDAKNRTIQTIGIRRDELINNIYENLNYDYINYLDKIGIDNNNKSCNNLLSASTATTDEKCNSGTTVDIIKVNSQKYLDAYIEKLIDTNYSLDSIKNTQKPDTVVNMSANDTVFSLVVKAIITHKIIMGLQGYSEQRKKFFDKNAFNDIMSIIAGINMSNYSVFGNEIFTYLKCHSLLYVKYSSIAPDICEECEKISGLIDDSVANFKQSINNIAFPHRLGISTLISIVFLFYISLFVTDAYAARKQIYQGMTQMNPFRQPGSMNP